jgi:hypothetical protein
MFRNSRGLVVSDDDWERLQKTSLHFKFYAKPMKVGNRDDFFTKHSMKDSKFKLKALAIGEPQDNFYFYYDVEEMSEQAKINSDMFVLQSADTLKSFNFNVWFSEDVNLALNKLPALKNLHIDEFSNSEMFSEDISKLQLKPNGIIKSLKCFSVGKLPKKTKFLACLTNLKILTAKYMCKGDFEWIARNMPTLKKLRINFWYPYEKEGAKNFAEKCYKELKNSESSINRNIKIIVA